MYDEVGRTRDSGVAVNHIQWESLPESLRQFLRGLTESADGAVIEENGRPVFRVTACSEPPAAAPGDVPWTEADNRRRVELIDLDLDGRLSPAERRELAELEARCDRYVDAIAPLPLEPLRQLLESLQKKAAEASGTPPA